MVVIVGLVDDDDDEIMMMRIVPAHAQRAVLHLRARTFRRRRR